jgi:formate/nitrite transporter FocA (FNT family)
VVVLAVLAGAFISLGAVFSTVVTAGGGVPAGPARLLGGLVFSLGLVLVVVAGAELFTGNALVVIATASRRVRVRALLRNWLIV